MTSMCTRDHRKLIPAFIYFRIYPLLPPLKLKNPPDAAYQADGR